MYKKKFKNYRLSKKTPIAIKAVRQDKEYESHSESVQSYGSSPVRRQEERSWSEHTQKYSDTYTTDTASDGYSTDNTWRRRRGLVTDDEYYLLKKRPDVIESAYDYRNYEYQPRRKKKYIYSYESNQHPTDTTETEVSPYRYMNNVYVTHQPVSYETLRYAAQQNKQKYQVKHRLSGSSESSNVTVTDLTVKQPQYSVYTTEVHKSLPADIQPKQTTERVLSTIDYYNIHPAISLSKKKSNKYLEDVKFDIVYLPIVMADKQYSIAKSTQSLIKTSGEQATAVFVANEIKQNDIFQHTKQNTVTVQSTMENPTDQRTSMTIKKSDSIMSLKPKSSRISLKKNYSNVSLKPEDNESKENQALDSYPVQKPYINAFSRLKSDDKAKSRASGSNLKRFFSRPSQESKMSKSQKQNTSYKTSVGHDPLLSKQSTRKSSVVVPAQPKNGNIRMESIAKDYSIQRMGSIAKSKTEGENDDQKSKKISTSNTTLVDQDPLLSKQSIRKSSVIVPAQPRNGNLRMESIAKDYSIQRMRSIVKSKTEGENDDQKSKKISTSNTTSVGQDPLLSKQSTRKSSIVMPSSHTNENIRKESAVKSYDMGREKENKEMKSQTMSRDITKDISTQRMGSIAKTENIQKEEDTRKSLRPLSIELRSNEGPTEGVTEPVYNENILADDHTRFEEARNSRVSRRINSKAEEQSNYKSRFRALNKSLSKLSFIKKKTKKSPVKQTSNVREGFQGNYDEYTSDHSSTPSVQPQKGKITKKKSREKVTKKIDKSKSEKSFTDEKDAYNKLLMMWNVYFNDSYSFILKITTFFLGYSIHEILMEVLSTCENKN